MKIVDIQRFSLIDYPGKICAIIFTPGCNFRCPYCHNPELVESFPSGKGVAERTLMAFLEQRRGKLDAVSITGGEPLLQRGLISFVERVRGLGYLVKIDTNGSRPDILRKLIDKPIVDYIAMDVKAPLEKYEEIVASPVKPEQIEESIHLIMKAGIDYEFRTTIVQSLLTEQDVVRIGTLIRGANRYVLQRFIPSKTLDPAYMKGKTWPDNTFDDMRKRLEKSVSSVVIR